MNYKIGLALSGGGARGAAHIGVIKAMEERNIEADIISGTSAGAIVGALLAAGHNADYMLDFFLNTPVFRPTNYTWKKPGLINTEALTKVLEPVFREDHFSNLKKPLFILATDIIKARQKVFSDGPLIKAILASASFPGIFAPVEIDESIYSDGGILNNFPVETIREACDHLIGVNIQHIEQVKKEDIKSTLAVVQRVFSISTRIDSVAKYHMCDTIIAPDKLTRYYTFDMFRLKKMYSIGYEAACIAFDSKPIQV